MRSARLENLQHAGVARREQVWLVRLGSASSRGCIATGKVQDQHAWPLVSGVLVLAVLSHGGAASSARGPRLPSMCHVRGNQQDAPAVSRLVAVVAAGGGRGPTPLRCHPRKDRGVDLMGSNATLRNVGEIRARLQSGKVHKPNDAISEVTGRLLIVLVLGDYSL